MRQSTLAALAKRTERSSEISSEGLLPERIQQNLAKLAGRILARNRQEKVLILWERGQQRCSIVKVTDCKLLGLDRSLDERVQNLMKDSKIPIVILEKLAGVGGYKWTVLGAEFGL